MEENQGRKETLKVARFFGCRNFLSTEILWALLLVATAGLFANDPVPYPVRSLQPTDDKFLRIHQAVAAAHHQRIQQLASTPVIIRRHVDGSTYLAEITRVSQLGVLSGNPVKSTLIGLTLKADTPIQTDGESLLLKLVKSSPMQYTDVLGSKRTVPGYKVAESEEFPGPDELFERLKKGEAFHITLQPAGQRPTVYRVQW